MKAADDKIAAESGNASRHDDGDPGIDIGLHEEFGTYGDRVPPTRAQWIAYQTHGGCGFESRRVDREVRDVVAGGLAPSRVTRALVCRGTSLRRGSPPNITRRSPFDRLAPVARQIPVLKAWNHDRSFTNAVDGTSPRAR